jgi:hypothetical protein
MPNTPSPMAKPAPRSPRFELVAIVARSPNTPRRGRTSSCASPRASRSRTPRCPRFSGITALQALRDAGSLVPGLRVLVVGASSGVGAFAVQLAHAMGAEVDGVCSAAKLELVRALGAHEVFNYAKADFTDGTRHWDLVLDLGGNTPLAPCVAR